MAKAKKQVKKYDIICGEGQHRTFTACIAELIMLNKYGNQKDYFWREVTKNVEYIKLIKLAGRIARQFDRDKLAFFIYKNPDYKFKSDIGLVIYNLRNFKYTNDNFCLEELVRVYTNKHRPTEQEVEIEDKQTVNKANITTLDFLGDV